MSANLLVGVKVTRDERDPDEDPEAGRRHESAQLGSLDAD